MNDLRIGDSNTDGSLSVMDVDRLCYRIFVNKNENSYVLTLPKDVLSACVGVLQHNPDSSTDEVKNQVLVQCQVNRVDEVELLIELSKMAIGDDPIVSLGVSDLVKRDFQNWQACGRVARKTAFENAVNYIPSIDEALAPATKHIWHGLREALYGERASLRIYEVGSYAKLMSEYGGLDLIFDKADEHPGFSDERYDNCFRWAHDRVNHGNIRAAWRWYKKYWLWRDSCSSSLGRTEKLDLTTALDLFQQVRGDDGNGPEEGVSYDTRTKEARTAFATADAGTFVDPAFDYAAFVRNFGYDKDVIEAFAGHTDAEKTEVGNFISQNRNSPQAVSWYLDPANKPNAEGMNACVILNLMTMVRPAEFALYAPPIDHMLVVTGVAKDLTPKELTVANYEANKALQGQVLAKMNELGIGKAADDDSAADFLTVGEFAWWISDETNLNLVKEKIMSTVAKEPKGDCAEDGKKSIVDALKDDVDSMMSRLTAALLTKPFAILAGASGTGKSRMVKKLAYMTCRADMLRSEKDETPGNYCMIAVKPNWHDSSDLLGYRSAFGTHDYVTTDFVKFVLKAHAFPNTPFFVCLDEMNLAPVEQYFAEYLSAVESVGKNSAGKWTGDPLIQRGEFGGAVANLHPEYQLTEEVAAAINDKGLFIPQNLFVVGTVNMDDTTNQFSRKVLDRAMTIMMNEVDFATLKGEGYEKLTNELRIKNEEIEKFIDRTIFSGALMDGGEIEDLLNGVRLVLQDSPFEVGYRYAIETVLYREAIKIIKGKSEPSEEELKDFTQTAIDHTILMKILPRITGTLTEREEVLKKLEECFGNLSPHKLSADTLKAMKKTADNNGGYISFWP